MDGIVCQAVEFTLIIRECCGIEPVKTEKSSQAVVNAPIRLADFVTEHDASTASTG